MTLPELVNSGAFLPVQVANPLKTTGTPRQFATGAQRDADAGKARFDLLPVTALERVSKHYAAGAAKYGENNWRKGIPRQEFLKSGLRHLFFLIRGDRDEDHAAAVVWNLLGFMETEAFGLDQPAKAKLCETCGRAVDGQERFCEEHQP